MSQLNNEGHDVLKQETIAGHSIPTTSVNLNFSVTRKKIEILIISPSGWWMGGGGGGVFCESTRKKWKNNSDGRRASDRSPDASPGWMDYEKNCVFPSALEITTGGYFF